MWSILENVLCALEKNVYSAAFGCDTNKYQLNLPGLVSHLRPVFPCWSVWMICPLMKVVFYSSPLLLCYCWCLLLRLLEFALYVEVLLCWVRILDLLYLLGLIPRSLCRELSLFSVVHLLSCVWLFTTLWTLAHQASLSFTLSLAEFAYTFVHWVDNPIQQSHPLSSPSPPALNLSQHQGLFPWVGSSHQVSKLLELWLQHQSFQNAFKN